jgi:diacylglycerol kinase family enzyme
MCNQAMTVKHRRLLALAALALLALALVGAVAIAAAAFPRGVWVLLCLSLAVPLAWYGMTHRGTLRWAALGVAGLAGVGALTLMIAIGPLLPELAVLAAVAAAFAAARAVFAIRIDLPSAPPPTRAVVIWNPKSGGGKAEKAHLDVEARKRGIEPIQLKRGDDLVELVRQAIAGGADGLAAAGGDGTQAIVAAAAAEHGLPYACIPAGTRNHFALDLGVDRDDVVGALDAFVSGGERLVDLAEVNGQVFVNNVSLGVYAEAVQKEGYRDAKLRTIFDSVPDALGPDGDAPDLRWSGPDGRAHNSGAVILVSNNHYRLKPGSSGTRPRLDDGKLGVSVFGGDNGDGERSSRSRLVQWDTPEFAVDSGAPIPAGVDGEAMLLDTPVRFTLRPGALRVRIARQHPGASPSAGLPDSAAAAVRSLAHVVAGRPA